MSKSRIFIGLGFVALTVIVLPVFFGGWSFWTRDIVKFATDRNWWAENYLAFIIFTVIVGAISWLMNVYLEKRHRAQFESWKVVIDWLDASSKQDLFWDEVEKFLNSDFERWKFIKSIVSGMGYANLTTVHKAEMEESRWVCTDRQERIIRVDLNKACDIGHVSPKNSQPDKSGGPL